MLKLVVRYLGVALVREELEPGEYVLGRAPGCDIRLTQDFISRRHGKIYFDDGRWLYADLRRDHPQFDKEPREIVDEEMIELENDIDIMTEGYLATHDTQVYDVRDLRSMAAHTFRNQRRIRLVGIALALLALLLGGAYAAYALTRPMNANELLLFARSKVVELEMVPDQEVMDRLQKLAALEPGDLKKSSGFCSGFIVAPDVVLTAHHCVRDSYGDVTTDFVVKTHDGEHHRPGQVLGLDARRDYLFLEVPGLEAYGALDLEPEHEIGQKVFTIGNVLGKGIAIREGITAATTADPDRPEVDYLRFSAAASPGNSGGPLVDGRGRVLGIVFAGTFSENYNVATASEHLISGMERFVEDRVPEPVTAKTRDSLNPFRRGPLGAFGIPEPEAFSEHPEHTRQLEELEITVTVPAELDDLERQSVESLAAAVREAYDDAVGTLRQKRLLISRWQDTLGEGHVLMVPYSNIRRRRVGLTLHNGTVVPGHLGLGRPPGPERVDSLMRKGRRWRSGGLLGAFGPELSIVESTASSAVYVDRGLGRLKLLPSYSGRGHTSGVVTTSTERGEWEAARNPSARRIVELLFGPEGALCGTGAFRFVRPRGRRDFTLRTLPVEGLEPTTVEDGAGRRWSRLTVPIFDVAALSVHCKPLPQGHLCLSRVVSTPAGPLREERLANYGRYTLPELVMAPELWLTAALVDFAGSPMHDDFVLPPDVRFDETADGGLVVHLDGAGLHVTFDGEHSPEALRINRGLLRDGDRTRWIATGVDALFRDGDDGSLCTVEVEPPRPAGATEERLETYSRHYLEETTVGQTHLGPDRVAARVRGGCLSLDEEQDALVGSTYTDVPLREDITVEIRPAGP